MKRLLAAMLLLMVVGCTGMVGAATNETPDPDEAKIINIVQKRLWERSLTCTTWQCFSQDYVLAPWWYAIWDMPMRLWDTAMGILMREVRGYIPHDEYWAAEPVNETQWVVTLQVGDTYVHCSPECDYAVPFLVDFQYAIICWTGLDWCQPSPSAQ